MSTSSLTWRLSGVVLSALFATSALGCAAENDDTEPEPTEEVGAIDDNLTKRLPTRFGGRGIDLRLTKDGGNLSFDCASGWLGGKLTVDAKGRFAVQGTFRSESGARPPGGRDAPMQPVTYRGTVTGNKMTLRFTSANGSQSFQLVANTDGALMRCM